MVLLGFTETEFQAKQHLSTKAMSRRSFVRNDGHLPKYQEGNVFRRCTKTTLDSRLCHGKPLAVCLQSLATGAGLVQKCANNLACWGFTALGLLHMSSVKAFYGFIMFLGFFTFETWSPFVSIVWQITVTPFSCETPAVFCGLKDFTRLSVSMRVTR